MLYSIYIRIKQSIVFKLEFLNQNLVYSLDKLVNFIQCPSNLILNSPTDLFAPPMNIMMNKKNSVTQYVNQHITIATSFASLNLNSDFAVKVVLLSAISPLLKIYILFLNFFHSKVKQVNNSIVSYPLISASSPLYEFSLIRLFYDTLKISSFGICEQYIDKDKFEHRLFNLYNLFKAIIIPRDNIRFYLIVIFRQRAKNLNCRLKKIIL